MRTPGAAGSRPTGSRSPRRWRDYTSVRRSPPAAIAIAVVLMGFLTAVEVTRTVSARHTVRRGWGEGVLIGLAIAVVLLIAAVIFLRLKNRRVGRTAATWLFIVLLLGFIVAAIDTRPPRYSSGPYVITSVAASAELGYVCALCLLIDGLILVAGYRMLRGRQPQDSVDQ